MGRRLQSQFADQCEYAVRQAVASIAATSVSEVEAVRSNLSAAFLIGILALLVTKPHVGETLNDIWSVLLSLYGLLLAWPVAYGIGPNSEWAHGLAIFGFLFLFDLLDESPLRSKIAQLLMLIVFALFATAKEGDTRDSLWLVPPRLAATCAIGMVTPLIVTFIWPRYAAEQISLRLRAAARVSFAAFALLACSFGELELSPTSAADGLRARGLRRLSQDLTAAAGALLLPARTEQRLRLGQAHANEHAQLLRIHSNLLAMERALNVTFHARFRTHMSRNVAPALALVLSSLKRTLNAGKNDGVSLADDESVANAFTNDASGGGGGDRVFQLPPAGTQLSFEAERVQLLRALFKLRRELYTGGTAGGAAPLHFDAREVSAVSFWIFHAISFLHHTELMFTGSAATIGLTLIDTSDGEGVEYHSADSETDTADEERARVSAAAVSQIDAPPEAAVAPATSYRARVLKRLPFALRNALAITIASLMFLIPSVNAVWEGFGMWCAVSTLLVLESDSSKSIAKSLRRLTGTALGAAFGALLQQVTTRNVYGNMVGLFFWLLLSGFVRAVLPPSRSYSAYVAGFTAILVIASSENSGQDVDLVASLRIQLTFLGCFVGIVSLMLPKPEWLGGELLRRMSEALALSGTATREIIRSVTLRSAPSTHIDKVRHLISSLAPLNEAMQGEPALWHLELPPVLTASVIKRLVCVQRRLVWCNSAAMRLHSQSSHVTLQIFVDPVQACLAETGEACASYVDIMSQLLVPRTVTLELRRELEERSSKALLALKQAGRTFATRYNDVAHSIVQSRNRMQTRDVIAFTAFVFAFSDLLVELEALYQDMSQLTAAVQLTTDGMVTSDLKMSTAGAWIQSAQKRQRRSSSKPLLSHEDSSLMRRSASENSLESARTASSGSSTSSHRWGSHNNKKRTSKRVSLRTSSSHVGDDDTDTD